MLSWSWVRRSMVDWLEQMLASTVPKVSTSAQARHLKLECCWSCVEHVHGELELVPAPATLHNPSANLRQSCDYIR